jgi:hypothetical protein
MQQIQPRNSHWIIEALLMNIAVYNEWQYAQETQKQAKSIAV